MQELGDRVVTFFIGYFVLVALMLPIVLLARADYLGERAERRLIHVISWLAFLIPVLGVVALTFAYYVAP